MIQVSCSYVHRLSLDSFCTPIKWENKQVFALKPLYGKKWINASRINKLQSGKIELRFCFLIVNLLYVFYD